MLARIVLSHSSGQTRRSLATVTKFTRSHEYISIDDKTLEGHVGISDFAQSKLGDVVFVELPDVGKAFKAAEA